MVAASASDVARPRSFHSLALAEFIRFILSRDGQQIILDQKVFLPLRAAQAGPSRATVE